MKNHQPRRAAITCIDIFGPDDPDIRLDKDQPHR
jgi:hypothetical protein